LSGLLLRGGRVLDPANRVDAVLDVLVRDGKIAALAPGPLPVPPGVDVVDVHGKLVLPGLVDLHVHLREPGEEYKEDIASGTRAAAAGGFTSVCCMANTTPVNDNGAVTEYIARRAREVGVVNVFPIGAVSKGLAGESLAEFGEMKAAGAVAVSDDGRPVMSAGLMRRALEYARSFDLAVIAHEEDLTLAAGGVMHEGFHATRLGQRGIPAAAEEVMVQRDIALARLTGGRLHIAHVSTARTVEALRAARAEGLRVTAEVTPHHLFLTDVACSGYDANFKMAPPLRSEADRAALRAGLAEGTIDAVATDHAPHSVLEKELEFDQAANGVVGLETAVPLVLRLVEEGVISLLAAIERLTSGPARVLGLPKGTLGIGADADITVIDPTAEWIVDPAAFSSRSRNTPFKDWRMRGRVVRTVVAGKVVHTA
jgi:dihydroorotase